MDTEDQLYYTILYKGFEHTQILVNIREVGPGTDPLQILRDDRVPERNEITLEEIPELLCLLRHYSQQLRCGNNLTVC